MLPPDTEEHQSSDKIDRDYTTIDPVSKSVDWSETVDGQQTNSGRSTDRREYYADIRNGPLVFGGVDR